MRWIGGGAPLTLLSCHFSFLTKTPSATEPFAASRVDRAFCTPCSPWCHLYTAHALLTLYTHTPSKTPTDVCVQSLPLPSKQTHTFNFFFSSHIHILILHSDAQTQTQTHILSVSRQRPSLPSAWLISLCNHQRCALWECLLGQRDATGAEGFTRLWKTARGREEQEQEVGGGGKGRGTEWGR